MAGMVGNWIGVAILAGFMVWFGIAFVICPDCPPVGLPAMGAGVFFIITVVAIRETLRRRQPPSGSAK
jgi:hypothetical protein